jgi:NTE family protein
MGIRIDKRCEVIIMSKGPIGLVLTGGGARGAYQAGVLSALLEICQEAGLAWPFKILTGTSAGGINACLLASHVSRGNLMAISQTLQDVWGGLSSSQVIDARATSLTANGINWLRSLSMGGVRTTKKNLALLDNSPLRELLSKHLDFSSVKEAIAKGHISALSLSMVNYSSGISRAFFMANEKEKGWKRVKREGLASELSVEHVMASSAIPLVFPPVKIDDQWYGDGSLRDYTPLSPAIKLGAKKLVIIGVRKRDQPVPEDFASPTPAKIFSTILNGILLDALDTDLERLFRINSTLEKVPGQEVGELKPIDARVFTPSRILSTIAEEEAGALPRTLQFLINGLGNKHEASDLISYILFEKNYTRRLIELGRADAFADKADFVSFLKE